MAYRCKSCGYRFKASDSDLCPECFTARDDISCFDVGGSGHSHFKDSAGGDDFIAQQMREESRMTGDELLEQISSVSDSFRRGFSREEVPPNTYQRAPEVRYQTQQQTENRYRYNTQTSYTPSRVGQNTFGQVTGESDPKKKSGAGCIVVFVLVCFLANSFGVVNKLTEWFEESDRSSAENPGIVITEKGTEDIALLPADSKQQTDDKITAEIGGYTFYNRYLGYDEPAVELGAGRIDAAPELTECVWYAVKCDITLSDSSCKADEITISGYDGNNELYSWEIADVRKEYGNGSKLYGVPLCFPLCQRYEVVVIYTDGNGEKNSLLLEPKLEEILGELGADTNTLPDPADFKYSYDYGTCSLQSSMNDMSGRNYRLKLNGTPHEYNTEDAAGTLVFEDVNLSANDLKLCKITVLNGDNAIGTSGYVRATLVGLDANVTPVYVYYVDGSDELPISSAVKYYELILGISDTDGFDKELHFAFYSFDLYDSK